MIAKNRNVEADVAMLRKFQFWRVKLSARETKPRVNLGCGPLGAQIDQLIKLKLYIF